MNRDIIGGFCWGVMLTISAYACSDYLSKSNDAEYKEKTLIELQIEKTKLSIKILKGECNEK